MQASQLLRNVQPSPAAHTYTFQMTKQEKMALKFALYKGPMSEAAPGAPPPPPIYPVKKVDGRTTARSTRAMQRRQATHYLTVPEIQFMQLTVSI